jgi:TRAP-type C4-dicarboxylate transport system permease small subunit
MTLIYSRLSPETQRVMDFIVTLFALLWTGFFAYASYSRMNRALVNNESTAGIIDIPFWMGMLWMVVGSILLGLVLLSRLIKVMAAEKFGQAKSAEETDRF